MPVVGVAVRAGGVRDARAALWQSGALVATFARAVRPPVGGAA
jgi:hypothetical protein